MTILTARSLTCGAWNLFIFYYFELREESTRTYYQNIIITKRKNKPKIPQTYAKICR